MTAEQEKPRLVLGAVEGEIDLLAGRLRDRTRVTLTGKTVWKGLLEGQPLLAAVTGVGTVNAAQSLTALMERFAVGSVVMVGSAGGYRESGVEVGCIVVARHEIFADLGIVTLDGWHPFEGPPMNLLPNDPACTHRFVLDYEATEKLRAAADSLGRTYAGVFLTVNGVSGDEGVAQARFERFRAVAENMEGAAAAQVCMLYGLPFQEVRGISNLAGDRDKRDWDLATAARLAQETVLEALEKGDVPDLPPAP